MNAPPLSLVLALLGMAAIWLALPVFRSASIGRAGERKVRRGLHRIGAVSFNDAYLLVKDRIAQVDHLVCTERGIVILETKDWTGRLSCQGPGKPWLLQQGGYRRTRHNPQDQNGWHQRVVSRYTRSVPLLAWVVLAGDGRFVGPAPEGVYTVREMLTHLQELGLDPNRFSPEIRNAWKSLLKNNLRDRASRRRQLRQATRSVWRYAREGYALEIFGVGVGLLGIAVIWSGIFF